MRVDYGEVLVLLMGRLKLTDKLMDRRLGMRVGWTADVVAGRQPTNGQTERMVRDLAAKAGVDLGLPLPEPPPEARRPPTPTPTEYVRSVDRRATVEAEHAVPPPPPPRPTPAPGPTVSYARWTMNVDAAEREAVHVQHIVDWPLFVRAVCRKVGIGCADDLALACEVGTLTAQGWLRDPDPSVPRGRSRDALVALWNTGRVRTAPARQTPPAPAPAPAPARPALPPEPPQGEPPLRALAGLTGDELAILVQLADATTAFLRLPRLHPNDGAEWIHAVHGLQNRIMARAAIRAHPDFFTKPLPGGGA